MNSKKFFDWCRTAVSSIKHWPQKDRIQKDLYVNYDINSTSYQAYASVKNLLSGTSGNTYAFAEIELYDKNDVLLQKKSLTLRNAQ